MEDYWLTHGHLVIPSGIVEGAVHVKRGRIAAVRTRAPRTARCVDLNGSYFAPGFIDLHVWGEPNRLAQALASHGTTAFLTTVGPDSAARLVEAIQACLQADQTQGALCLGLHVEGPFVSRARAGALPKRWMRRPTVEELQRLQRAAGGRVRLVTLAPELPGGMGAIRWCRGHGAVASLGHSEADAPRALQAVDEGATAVTHVFNGMRPFHHRQPVLLDVALTDRRLTTMVIFDGVHVSPHAFRLLVRAKGIERIALVTDSIRYQGWDVVRRRGAYYTRAGVLAGSDLTMVDAVRNAVLIGGVSVSEAVRMASEVPARLLGLARSRGILRVGARADLVVFDRRFRVLLTLVNGQVVYERRH